MRTRRTPLHPCLGAWAWVRLLPGQPHLLRRLPPAQHLQLPTQPLSRTPGPQQAPLERQQQVLSSGQALTMLYTCLTPGASLPGKL